jgi:hypothetical protein
MNYEPLTKNFALQNFSNFIEKLKKRAEVLYRQGMKERI